MFSLFMYINRVIIVKHRSKQEYKLINTMSYSAICIYMRYSGRLVPIKCIQDSYSSG